MFYIKQFQERGWVEDSVRFSDANEAIKLAQTIATWKHTKVVAEGADGEKGHTIWDSIKEQVTQ